MNAALLALLVQAATPTPGCVDIPPGGQPEGARHAPGRTNQGLPALGTVILTAGGTLGLLSVFAASTGALAAMEQRATPWVALTTLMLTSLTATLLALAAVLVAALGGSIWFLAWLPPASPARLPCPPAEAPPPPAPDG